MPLYPKSTMYDPSSGDSPWMSGLKAVGRALGWNDPNAVMGVGMPMGAGATAEAEPAAVSVLDRMNPQVVSPTTVQQMAPSASDVSDLVSGMQANLKNIPTSASRTPSAMSGWAASSPGNYMSDLASNPAVSANIDRMYQQANPVFQQLQDTGAFSGDRTVGAGNILQNLSRQYAPKTGSTVSPAVRGLLGAQ